VKRAGSAVELRPAPKAHNAAHPQERTLIAGPPSTAFWPPDGPEHAPHHWRLRSRSKVGYSENFGKSRSLSINGLWLDSEWRRLSAVSQSDGGGCGGSQGVFARSQPTGQSRVERSLTPTPS
jgi:hypothetical protein